MRVVGGLGGKAERAHEVASRLLEALSDPDRSVLAERRSQGRVVPFARTQHAYRAFLDDVREVEPFDSEGASDRRDQWDQSDDQLLAGCRVVLLCSDG